MHGMVLSEYKSPLSWQRVPDPKCGPWEVILRVGANGLCATDLKIADGMVPSVNLPHILGHESVLYCIHGDELIWLDDAEV